MFNDLNGSSPEGAKEVDDIFSDVDKPAAPAAMPTFSGNPPIQTPTPAQTFPGTGRETYLNVEDNMPAAGERGTKFLKIFLILIVIAAVVAVAGYFIYTQFIQPQKEINSNINAAPLNSNNDVPTDIEDKINQQENNVATATDIVTEVPTTTTSTIDSLTPTITDGGTTLVETPGTISETVDTDTDGLNDQEEALAGTDINKVDTDGDGLSDYEEVKTYLTNPLSADTDGDTYSDGSEVKNGYNPNGDGKLIPKI